jgi:hypothetical protein
MPTRSGRSLAASVVLPLAALVAILPMLVRGPSCGHDFDFHLLSWLEAANQFAHLGYPHWAYTPAWNAGEPRFIFYPPISWTLGAFLGLVLPWNAVPTAFTWIALTLSGLTMYRLAVRYASPAAALIAATLYLANPYMLFTAYDRTAYGELLAAAWLPLLFAAALAPHVKILPIAIPLALLWLTNAPAAVMSSYALAFLTLIRLLRPPTPYSLLPVPSRLRLALNTISGTALGLALAAFYIVPAAYERRYVQVNLAVTAGMRVSDHFLFHRMPGNTFDDRFHDIVVHTASVVALTLLAAIAVAALAAWRSRPTTDCSLSTTHYPLFLLTLLIAFLLTPPSLILWNHIPQLAFLQFPWRLSAILGVILALLTAIALNRLKPPFSIPYSLIPIPCLFLAAALVYPSWHNFHQRCFPEDTIPARVALFHSNLGTDPTDEYTPIGADGDALQPGDPPWWLIPATASADINVTPPHPQPGPAPNHLALTLPAAEYLVLNRRQYPVWHITLNGKPIAPIPHKRTDGLITVLLPAGPDTVDLTLTHTPDQTIGLTLSLCALMVTIGIRKPHPPPAEIS